MGVDILSLVVNELKNARCCGDRLQGIDRCGRRTNWLWFLKKSERSLFILDSEVSVKTCENFGQVSAATAQKLSLFALSAV
ncbi:hypothetical protein NBRC116587_21630 [Pseudoteredinibacter isoporae]